MGDVTEKRAIMTLQETADYLQVHEMTMYRWIKAKKVPAFRVGGRWRVMRSVLDEFLQASSLGDNHSRTS